MCTVIYTIRMLPCRQPIRTAAAPVADTVFLTNQPPRALGLSQSPSFFLSRSHHAPLQLNLHKTSPSPGCRHLILICSSAYNLAQFETAQTLFSEPNHSFSLAVALALLSRLVIYYSVLCFDPPKSALLLPATFVPPIALEHTFAVVSSLQQVL